LNYHEMKDITRKFVWTRKWILTTYL
jgi:hypothetical protein